MQGGQSAACPAARQARVLLDNNADVTDHHEEKRDGQESAQTESESCQGAKEDEGGAKAPRRSYRWMSVRGRCTRAHVHARRGLAAGQGRRCIALALRPFRFASFREGVMPNFSLTWLPQVLLGAGLKVSETDDWKSRGRGEMGPVKGVMCHHTATPASAPGNMPTLKMLIEGRPDLPGPLAQLGLGRDGTFFIVAAGRCNHAGVGNWQGFTAGNTNFIGIEGENPGLNNAPWPDMQMDAYRRGVAAILKKVKADAIMCCGHKEYALPHGRKSDPDFNMTEFRNQAAMIMAGAAPAASVIPKA